MNSIHHVLVSLAGVARREEPSRRSHSGDLTSIRYGEFVGQFPMSTIFPQFVIPEKLTPKEWFPSSASLLFFFSYCTPPEMLR